MNSFINEHRTKIKGYTVSKFNYIKMGNVIRFSYPSETNKYPHVFVLNPRYQGKLHGLVVDYINPRLFNKLKDFIISEAEEVEPGTPNDLVISLRELSKNSQTPMSFYDIRLKPFIKKYLNGINCYRTYDIVKIGNLNKVNYVFSKYKEVL